MNAYDARVTARSTDGRRSTARRPRLPILTLIAVAALSIGFVATAYSLPIDDFWLTLASGAALLDGAPIDRALDFTWTPMLDGALNPQWGAQLIFAAPDSVGGALAINAALIAIGLLTTVQRTARRATGSAVAIAMLLVVAAIAPHLLARAQSFSIALMPVALLLLARYRNPAWLPVAYGLVMVVWANTHGAFVIGQIAVLAALVAAMVGRTNRVVLATTAVVALLAPLANPSGLELFGYAYGQPGLELIRQISVEWQPAWPWIPLTWLFWAQAGLFVAFRISRRGGAPLDEILLGAALLVLAATSLRQIPWFCLATAPILAEDISTFAGGRLGERLGSMPGWCTGRKARVALLSAAAVAVLIQPIRPLAPQAVARVTPDAPVALVDRLAGELDDSGSARVLNEQVWGGYLAYALGDRIETAMDGRIEIRDRSTWASYFSLMRGEGNAVGELAANDVDWALLALDRETLVRQLTDSGWTTVDRDAQGVLLSAP